MMAFLVTVRDVLLAVALAWIGITLESREPDTQQNSCSAQSCERER